MQIDIIEHLVRSSAKKCGTQIEVNAYLDPRNLLFETEDPQDWPDLICLDVNMPSMMGTEVARKMRRRGQRSAIIFFSVLQDVDILLAAFDVRAINYFVKGDLDVDRFHRVFADLAGAIEEDNQEAMVFSCAGETRNILVKDIRYFEVKRHVITVYYGDTSFEFYSQLAAIAETLRGRGFLMTNRAFLVSLSAIESLTTTEVILKSGEKLPLSRTYSTNVRKAIHEYGI